MRCAATKHFAPSVRNLCQEVEHGCVFSLVHIVYPLLASGFAGYRAIPDCVADHAAFPHRWDRGTWRVRPAFRTFCPSRTGPERPACDLGRLQTHPLGNMRVNPARSVVPQEKTVPIWAADW